eukprot:TRINITY_DN8467_c0_g1_i3.p1 TRINITY_DN8467_c0_g1~~TRINITY_DN8467_c0_g1_i3.p1  ORF type:complete len:481 (-),score=57.39 TRINITY_DN8467_c0_g1_i3:102-1520(-)
MRFYSFPLGPASQSVGQDLVSLYPPIPSNISGAAAPAALILIDRGMDLITPLTASDHPLDFFMKLKQGYKQQAMMPKKLVGNRAEFAPTTVASWDIKGLVKTEKEIGFNPFIQCGNESREDHFQQLVGLKGRDALMQTCKWLRDAAKQSAVDIKPGKGTQASANELQDLIGGIIQKDQKASQQWFEVLGLATGVVKAMKQKKSQSEEFVAQCEWFMKQTDGQSGRLDLIDRLDYCLGLAYSQLTFSESLKLTVIMTTVLATLLSDAYSNELLTDFELSDIRAKLINKLIEFNCDSESVQIPWLEEVLEQLGAAKNKRGEEKEYALTGVELQLDDLLCEKLASIQSLILQRMSLIDLNRVSDKDGHPKSMVGQIVESILKEEEIRDLNKSQSSIGSLLQSGLGRLGFGGGSGQQQSQFHDMKVVVIFVVGGVCMREIREVTRATQEWAHQDKQIIIGGTTMVDDVQVINNLLK